MQINLRRPRENQIYKLTLCLTGFAITVSAEHFTIPGILRLGKFSGRHQVIKLKFQEFWDFFGNVSRFSGVLLITCGSAQLNSIC